MKPRALLAILLLVCLLCTSSCGARDRKTNEAKDEPSKVEPILPQTEQSPEEGEVEMNQKGNYHGKLFSVMGDSISTLDGYNEPEEVVFYTVEKREKTGVVNFTDTWWGDVIDTLGAKLLANNSVSGSTVSVNPKSSNVYLCGCSDERTSTLDKDGKMPDVIMIFLSINDGGIPAKAAPESDAEANDPTIFSVAYRLLLSKLQKNYPDAEIWCITVPKSDQSDRTHTAPYTEQIVKIAPEMGVKLIDLRDAERYESLDGLHPTVNGMHTIASEIVKRVLQGE